MINGLGMANNRLSFDAKILHVDDDRGYSNNIKDFADVFMPEHEFISKVVPDEDSFKKIKEEIRTTEEADCLITDGYMPGGGGLELIDSAKKNSNIKNIFMLTNAVTKGLKEQVEAKGAKFLDKTDGAKNVIKAIKEALDD